MSAAECRLSARLAARRWADCIRRGWWREAAYYRASATTWLSMERRAAGGSHDPRSRPNLNACTARAPDVVAYAKRICARRVK